MGLLLAVVVHAAAIQDRDGAKLVMMRIAGRFPRLKLIWADGGYAGLLIDWVKAFGDWVLEIVKRLLIKRVLPFCHAAGLLSALSHGLAAAGASAKITKGSLKPVKSWFLSA
jgi:hypothetical protein